MRVKSLKPLAPVLAAMLLAVFATSALASDVATDLFEATATTGKGSPMPIDISPSNVAMRADGAVGLGYTYKATGVATGDVPGPFTYEEHGYLFFRNPSDPTTFAGSRYDGGVFTLHPADDGDAPITIADTNPTRYQSGVRTVTLPHVDPLLASYRGQVFTLLGLTPVGNSIRYGYFTFTDAFGTFFGVSTPDSRHFLLRLKFAIGQDAAGSHHRSVATGNDFNQNERFGQLERGN
jgi:hypothetical protein